MAENQNGNGEHLQNVAEQLYKQNLELATKNKTLQLLRELYEISILALEPRALAEKVCATIQKTLELELVGILNYDQAADQLAYLAKSGSERFQNACKKVDKNNCFSNIDNAGSHPFFSEILRQKTERRTENFAEAFGSEQPADESHIVFSLFSPLVIEGQVIGILSLNFNRSYDGLSQDDKDQITSLVNVVTVALDRATLYQQIKLANEKLRELDKAKTEFVSIASHQLRAPLTAIKGYTSMILEGSFGEVGEKARGALSVIFQSSQKLVSVIEDFLNITRIELGKMKYEMTNFDLQQLIELVAKELKLMIESKGLKLVLDWDRTQNYQINADYGKISQVVNNLIDNAAKYSKQGEIKIVLTKADGKVRLAIKDQGTGLTPETMNKLFNKFVRADGAGQANVAGTGLGLYVAKQIVEAHGGRIWAESEGEGKGSTFSFELEAK